MSVPRTWTLQQGHEPSEAFVTPVGAPEGFLNGRHAWLGWEPDLAIEVVELEPVLDLLAACEPYVFGCGEELEDLLSDFLQSHGRLVEGPS